ncbi:unnamed protein product [Linum tenue]|uniref:ATP-dependent Clp protease proteolytic subunit n=1 Tax=Linum tenue TaxID=586396 RepID=A0AAV0K6N9_9ROSI|nr:unnamed protein product [Linum tenue]
MSLVPSVTELILAEFLYLQYEDEEKPIYLYINGGEKLSYETEAFAIYDVMGYVKPPIFTLCVGNAWGEAALLLAAGAKGNRSALPSSTIMIKQPIGRFQGQATDVELARKEMNNVKAELVSLWSTYLQSTSGRHLNRLKLISVGQSTLVRLRQLNMESLTKSCTMNEAAKIVELFLTLKRHSLYNCWEMMISGF